MELSKEYFDEQIKKLATKADINELARMVNEGFEDLQQRLDVKERVERLENEMKKIKDALHVS